MDYAIIVIVIMGALYELVPRCKTNLIFGFQEHVQARAVSVNMLTDLLVGSNSKSNDAKTFPIPYFGLLSDLAQTFVYSLYSLTYLASEDPFMRASIGVASASKRAAPPPSPLVLAGPDLEEAVS